MSTRAACVAHVGSGELARLPRFRGPSVTLRTEMPCRLDGEPQPTPRSVTVLPGAWRVLLPPA